MKGFESAFDSIFDLQKVLTLHCHNLHITQYYLLATNIHIGKDAGT